MAGLLERELPPGSRDRDLADLSRIHVPGLRWRYSASVRAVQLWIEQADESDLSVVDVNLPLGRLAPERQNEHGLVAIQKRPFRPGSIEAERL